MKHSISTAQTHPTGANVRHVEFTRPFHWLSLGWEDLKNNPYPSIFHGFIFAALGWLIIVICSTQIELLALALSGFLLVGPIFGAGFYALSRMRARAESGF